LIAALLYVAAVATANVVTARTVPADIGPFLVTWGTWIVGATFVLRDLVQLQLGRRGAYAAIGAGWPWPLRVPLRWETRSPS
jgi:uncharacterized PurR-regulated membrane protein YhhQ (DUF165 family)